MSRLRLEDYLEPCGKNQWKVKREIPFYCNVLEGHYFDARIPVGFMTDVCTKVPDCDWYACVCHDWVYTLGDYIKYRHKKAWRLGADRKLRDLIKMAHGLRFARLWASLYYVGVRLFGSGIFWEKSTDSESLVEQFAFDYPQFRVISVFA